MHVNDLMLLLASLLSLVCIMNLTPKAIQVLSSLSSVSDRQRHCPEPRTQSNTTSGYSEPSTSSAGYGQCTSAYGSEYQPSTSGYQRNEHGSEQYV